MIKVEVAGLDELIRECEKVATPLEMEEVNKRALKRCGELVGSGLNSAMPRSKDVTKSGRKGSRTYLHSADNVPMSIKKQNGQLVLYAGWSKGDISPYYYTKFIEFGSSKMPPLAPFKKTFIKQRKEWDAIFLEEYEKLIEKIGGD